MVKNYRSSRPEVFCKKGVLRNFAKFTGKYLCQSLFFNKVTSVRPATLLKRRLCNFIKKETMAQLFSCEFCEISKYDFFYRTPPMNASEIFQCKRNYMQLLFLKTIGPIAQNRLFLQDFWIYRRGVFGAISNNCDGIFCVNSF